MGAPLVASLSCTPPASRGPQGRAVAAPQRGLLADPAAPQRRLASPRAA